MKLRTNIQTTPLFVGSVVLTATGRAKLTFKAPDNIARFAVRALVVGNNAAPGVFAETETHLVVRKPLSLLPSQPRIVRSRDTFNCGVTVTLHNAKFDGGFLWGSFMSRIWGKGSGLCLFVSLGYSHRALASTPHHASLHHN